MNERAASDLLKLILGLEVFTVPEWHPDANGGLWQFAGVVEGVEFVVAETSLKNLFTKRAK